MKADYAEKTSVLTDFESLSVIPNLRKTDSVGDDFVIFNNLDNILASDKKPIRMDRSVISTCTAGYLKIAVNMQEYYVGAGSLFIAFPDQILQILEVSRDYRGVSIVATKKMLDEVFPKVKTMIRLFFYTKEYPCINLASEEISSLMNNYNLFWSKIKNKSNDYINEIIQALLVVMLYEIFEIYLKRVPRKLEKRNRKHVLFDQFMRLLSEYYKKERSVNFYAAKLYLTPKHLSSVVKEVSGKTAGEWIDNFVIFEAKILLKSSSKNIQEISDELNFANQSFFGKYFKHYTGMSPKEYRK